MYSSGFDFPIIGKPKKISILNLEEYAGRGSHENRQTESSMEESDRGVAHTSLVHFY